MRFAVVEDEPDISTLIVLQLDFAGRRDTVEMTPAEAMEADWQQFDWLVCDWWMPDHDGGAVIEHARSQHPDLRVVVLSAFVPERTSEIRERVGDDVFVLSKAESKKLRELVQE